ncbi:2-phosphosulfolactate phosphatase [Oscillochloris sp. ZM17-4]|uniref:2-phosphosulfolactate phosphatase n=1 Tax=Oscillochloris sp. ZM17-4 TaxID=2866714 RepID=UPI001C72D26A|nr:2-phosphosulfolactate phosphatase [Oscillochloris sp. ZM17-4]MBX0328122.1 2-phosphosulfolactate phosphatase [Oscillochloris sp. ZM17-4]
MEIVQTTLARCGGSRGAVVVIDVLRSFSTAAYAFAAGARQIYLAESPEDAFQLRERLPGALTMGGVGGGGAIPGFDLDNAPSRVPGHDLAGKTLIHCTAAGIKGLLRCAAADPLLAGSLVCAAATARLLLRLRPAHVTLVVTGDWSDRDGDEDRACADYLAALLRGQTPDPRLFAARVAASDFGRRFGSPAYPALPAADVAYAAAVDRFDFAMPVRREADRMLLEPISPDTMARWRAD